MQAIYKKFVFCILGSKQDLRPFSYQSIGAESADNELLALIVIMPANN